MMPITGTNVIPSSQVYMLLQLMGDT